MDDELVELLERAGIEEQRDPLARRQLPLGVLALDALLAAAQLALAFAALQLFELRLATHRITPRSVAMRCISASRSSAFGSFDDFSREPLPRLLFDGVHRREISLQRDRHQLNTLLGIAEFDDSAVLETVHERPSQELDLFLRSHRPRLKHDL